LIPFAGDAAASRQKPRFVVERGATKVSSGMDTTRNQNRGHAPALT
jgi:hypothetical protein